MTEAHLAVQNCTASYDNTDRQPTFDRFPEPDRKWLGSCRHDAKRLSPGTRVLRLRLSCDQTCAYLFETREDQVVVARFQFDGALPPVASPASGVPLLLWFFLCLVAVEMAVLGCGHVSETRAVKAATSELTKVSAELNPLGKRLDKASDALESVGLRLGPIASALTATVRPLEAASREVRVVSEALSTTHRNLSLAASSLTSSSDAVRALSSEISLLAAALRQVSPTSPTACSTQAAPAKQ
jgi:hypothetical protein